MGEHPDGGTTSPRNALVVRRAVEEIWNQGNLDVADSLFTAAYVNYGGLIPDLVRGPEAIKIAVAIHHSAYPDLHIKIEHMIAERDLVAFRWVARNLPVGKPVGPAHDVMRGTLRGMTFCRLALGKIVESWTSWEPGGVLRTLVKAAGLLPSRGSITPSGLN